MWYGSMRASTFDRRRARKSAALAVLATFALAGCFAALRVELQERSFDHSHHVKRGLECIDYHAEAKTSRRPGMPKNETCTDCHGETDEPSVAAIVSAYLARPADAKHAPSPIYGDVKFDHSKHAAKGLECAACHEGATTQALPNPAGPMRMAACVSCHKEKSGPLDCRSCHETWAKEVKPRSHLGCWELGHGTHARTSQNNVTVANVERCDLCHARNDCDRCHQREAPRSHTEAWRTATHGLAASIDRSKCMTCHAADSCNRCHQVQPPHSHNAPSFGAPRDGHCVTCHEPVGSSACGVCHKGTPSHQRATPRPTTPAHSAAMNCRQCHGAGQPLPHADNGTECTKCHH